MGAQTLETFSNHQGTVLAADINSSTTTVTIASATNFPSRPQYRIRVDDEIMLVTARTGTTLTVTRGSEGTTAASHTSPAVVSVVFTAAGIGNYTYEVTPDICEGRLTGVSGVPIDTSSSSTTRTTIYYTPYTGNRVRLYNGTTWDVHSTAEISLALGTITSDKNYDVFAYYDSGTDTVKLELSAAWTSDTARADALADQDGMWVKSGTTTRRYLGTFRSTSTTGFVDYLPKRFLWNYRNRVIRPVYAGDATASWSYSSTTIRQANAATANQIEVVAGLAYGLINVEVYCACLAGATGFPVVGIGVNSTTAFTVDQHSHNDVSTNNCLVAYLRDYPRVGYSKYCWLEKCTTANSHTFYGTSADLVSAIRGWYEC